MGGEKKQTGRHRLVQIVEIAIDDPGEGLLIDISDGQSDVLPVHIDLVHIGRFVEALLAASVEATNRRLAAGAHHYEKFSGIRPAGFAVNHQPEGDVLLRLQLDEAGGALSHYRFSAEKATRLAHILLQAVDDLNTAPPQKH